MVPPYLSCTIIDQTSLLFEETQATLRVDRSHAFGLCSLALAWVDAGEFQCRLCSGLCAGLYFSPRMAWLAPMGAMLLTDLLLNAYYDMAFQWYQLGNYLGYALLIGLGRWMHRSAHWSRLLRGHSWSPCFYLITNTLSWWFNPFEEEGYTRDMTGWLLALTKGTVVFHVDVSPQHLASGALFTGLFVGAAKWVEATQSRLSRPKPTLKVKQIPILCPKNLRKCLPEVGAC